MTGTHDGSSSTRNRTAIVAGGDEHGLGEELAAVGVAVTRLDDHVTAEALREAGVAEADYLVLTEVEEATGIPVAKDLNPGIVAVTYSERSLPEFVAAISDLAIDPALLSADVVAEELVAETDGAKSTSGETEAADDDATTADDDATTADDDR